MVLEAIITGEITIPKINAKPSATIRYGWYCMVREKTISIMPLRIKEIKIIL